jgi:hypothetical protein
MTTTLSSVPYLTAGRARGCRCGHPWRDDDTCLRCGRRLPTALLPQAPHRRSRSGGNPWTPAGVLRALRTYEFFVGRPPKSTDWSRDDGKDSPGLRTIAAMFGSFEAAVEAARRTPARSAA